MSEPVNFLHVRNGVTNYVTTKHGAPSCWRYGLDGLEKTLQAYSHSDYHQPLRFDFDAGLLVNEDTHDMVVGFEVVTFSHSLPAFQERFRELDAFPYNSFLVSHYLKMVKLVWQGWNIKFAEAPTFANPYSVKTDANEIPWADIDDGKAKITLSPSEIYLGFAAFYSIEAYEPEKLKIDAEMFLESLVTSDETEANHLLSQSLKHMTNDSWCERCQEKALAMRPVLRQLQVNSATS